MLRSSASSTVLMTLSSVFVALTAVCSWISIPVPGTAVPINLATFAVILTGLLLGSRAGALAMTVFLLLGAAGLPVFSGFTGGIGILLGPTGGFLIGYILLAAIIGRVYSQKDPAPRAGSRSVLIKYLILALLGEAALYLCGVLWFIPATGSGPAAAVAACVLPFLPGDLLKVLLAWFVCGRLRKALPSLF